MSTKLNTKGKFFHFRPVFISNLHYILHDITSHYINSRSAVSAILEQYVILGPALCSCNIATIYEFRVSTIL